MNHNGNIAPTQPSRNLAQARLDARQELRALVEAIRPVLTAVQAGQSVGLEDTATLCVIMRATDERVRHLYTVQVAAASRDDDATAAVLKAFAPVLAAVPRHLLVSTCCAWPIDGPIIDGIGRCSCCREPSMVTPSQGVK